MSLKDALKVKEDWDDHFFNGRPKTRQILDAERLIEDNPSSSLVIDYNFKKKLKSKSEEFGRLVKEMQSDKDFNESEKAYVITLTNQIKSFYDRYKRRLK